MIFAQQATGGMVVASHHLAAQAGLEVLREGGNAVEAMVTAAATIGVVYPHMNGLGGDGFWLIHDPGRAAPVAISAIGAAGQTVDPELYRRLGLEAIPARGPLASNTVAATVAGWQAALEHAKGWGTGLPLARLLEPAIHYARDGFPVSGAQHHSVADSQAELADVHGWAETFLSDGEVPETGSLFKQPALAETLARLAEAGLDDFYRGQLARTIAADLARAECPVSATDLAGQQVAVDAPLSLSLSCGTAFNVPPPAQGVVSLILLGLFERLAVAEADGFDHVHGAVEAAKRAFLVRNAHITDPRYMTVTAEDLLGAETLDRLAAEIDRRRALPWPAPAEPGDTVWLAAADAAGRVVSFIHSLYWHFGSAVVLRDTGIQWQNRGSSFSLDPNGLHYLQPGRLPFHTNNPAMTYLKDGRVMAYGTMGGDGQPQIQAAIFTRYALYGQGLQQAVTAPRWLLGRTWGDERNDLRMEGRFPADLIAALQHAGHQIEVVADFDAVMGHAGALVARPNGVMEGAGDPRSDGTVACF